MPSLEDREELRAYLLAIIFGKAGLGKTVLAHRFPGSTRTLDFDDGLLSVQWGIKEGVIEKDKGDIIYKNFPKPRDFEDYKYVLSTALNQLDQWIWEEIVEGKSWTTLIVDSATTVNEFAKAQGVHHTAIEMGMEKDAWVKFKESGLMVPHRSGWGTSGTAFQQFIMGCMAFGKNVIILAHERIDEDKNGSVQSIQPAFIGRMRSEMPGLVDEVWNMDMKTKQGETTRYIRTVGTNIITAKSRLGCLESLHDADFEDIIETVAEFYEVPQEEVWSPPPLTEKDLEDLNLSLDDLYHEDLHNV